MSKKWEQSGGFLGGLRLGIFDPNGAERLENILKQVGVEGSKLECRFVSLVWFIPIFLEWQKARFEANEDERAKDIQKTIERIMPFNE